MARRGFPMARGGGRDLPRAGTLSSAKASRHGARAKEFAHTRTLSSAKASRHSARAKGFAPRRNTPLGEGLPTRRTGEKICPAQERSPRRRPPDTAHGRKDLCRAGARSSTKVSRHGARAKGFAHTRTLSSAKASRHGARAKGFAPRRNAPLGESLPTRRTSEGICAAGVRVRPTCRRTAGRPRPTDSRKNTPSAGSHPRGRGRCRVHSPKKNKTTP